MKRILLAVLFLVALLLIACGGEPQVVEATPEPTPAPTATPVPHEEDPVAAPVTEEPKTLPPAPTATPVPTPTPEPTPEPTPTPVPYAVELEANTLKALAYGTESFTLVSTRGACPSVLSEPDPSSKYLKPFESVEGVGTHEWILLDTVATETRTYLHLRPIGAEQDGYLDARRTYETHLCEPESPYALTVRPQNIVYNARLTDSPVVAHADYEAVRVLGVDEAKGFAAILTGDDRTGYVQLGQIRFVTEEEFLLFVHQACETPECDFSTEALVSDAAAYVGKPYLDTASFLYDLLCAEGLHFNKVYYEFYQKPLDDETLYPKHLYVSAVYNSMMFRLFNSSGAHVTCNGEETEWAYIGDYDELEAGDLLFFADDYGKGDAVIPDVEVVVHGPYSGDLTDCGLYLGDGRMLTVRNGVVKDVEIDPVLKNTFDCARRIHSQIVDERAHLIESLIAMIYDRLGTPYHSIRRTGDGSYDCSGLLCWLFRSFDYRRVLPKEPTLDMTATAWSNVKELISPAWRLTFVDTGIKDSEGFGDLRRGDLILLKNDARNKVGHVMIYLGGNTVIHSTRIDGRYQGTLVARFRPHLQSLYYCSRRIESMTPVE